MTQRPVLLAGVGAITQRADDHRAAREPLDLMLEAVRLAGADCGGAAALSAVQRVYVPKGRWRYRDPGREIARAIGADGAVTVLAHLGVLQQSLISDACRRVADGEIDVALVVGGDAGQRMQRARLAGERAPERQQATDPDVLLEAEEELLHPAELRAGIRMPAALYAIIESAWRAQQGVTPSAHRRALGELYARFATIAAENPQAWKRSALTAEEIVTPGPRNPMQALPYTRLQCSDWNVDQAAALLLCAEDRADALGVSQERRIYARVGTESNHMTAVSVRAHLHDCAGARLAGQAALAAMGIAADELDLVDLYSCFPIAVESYAHALGLPLTRDLTITGGMSFAGGPFNNYQFQAVCRMAERLRAGDGNTALVSAVSGILTKQGFGIWSREPGPFVFADVTEATMRETHTVAVAEAFHGRAVIAGYTVVYERDQAPRALILADTEDRRRALAWSDNAELVQAMERSEFCGRPVTIAEQRFTT